MSFGLNFYILKYTDVEFFLNVMTLTKNSHNHYLREVVASFDKES